MTTRVRYYDRRKPAYQFSFAYKRLLTGPSDFLPLASVTVQSLVPGSGERGEGVAAVVGGDEFAQVGE